MSMTSVPLPEVAAIVMGQSPPGSTYNERGDGLPFFQGKAEFGDLSPTPKKWCSAPQRIAEAGDILMSVRAPVGPTNLASCKCCIGRGLAAIRANAERLDSTYLRFFLRHVEPRLASMGQGSTFAAIGRAEIASLRIPLPSLDEQRRTVDLLSRVEGIVRLRREAQAKAQAVIPALFLDMFGDPATNPKGWAESPLRALVQEFRYGTSNKSGDSGLPTLRIPNVVGDRLDPREMKLVPVTEAEAARLRLLAGDLLFVRTNGNPDYVGRSAVYEPEVMTAAGFDASDCIYASYLIRARLVANEMRPVFLQSFLSSHEGRKRLREQARTSAGQYNINTEGLGSILIPQPPLDMQARFEERCRLVLGIVAQQSEALKKAEATFQSLLSRAFSDELIAAAPVEEVAVA